MTEKNALDGIENVRPDEIEKRSFEIITELLGDRYIPESERSIITRVIHTTADFEYADTMTFSPGAVEVALEALSLGRAIVTDTAMAAAGIGKKALEACGSGVFCFMDKPGTLADARQRGITRAAVCMEKAAEIPEISIYVIGNAPTALVRLFELIREGKVRPAVIIGVPVGFVNVVESKELIMKAGIPYIVNKGRKGGSAVAASIINALLKMTTERK